MWKIWANYLLPKAFKFCLKSNKSPDLVTPTPKHWRDTIAAIQAFQSEGLESTHLGTS